MDEYVRILRKALENFNTLTILQVQGQASLVPVDR
jgi:hypothetical protein